LEAGASYTPLVGFGSNESTLPTQRPVLEIYFKKPAAELVLLPEGEGLDDSLAGFDLEFLAADLALVYGPAVPASESALEQAALDLPLLETPQLALLPTAASANEIKAASVMIPVPGKPASDKTGCWKLDPHVVDVILAGRRID
jgi:hypothetical protein